MRLLVIVVMTLITIALIVKGSMDAERMHEDYVRFNGDPLVKAISDYNNKTNSLKGYVGGAGVTRAPLIQNYDERNPGTNLMGRDKAMSRGSNYKPSFSPQPMQSGSPFSKPSAPQEDYYPPPPSSAVKGSTVPGQLQQDEPAQPADDYYPPAPIDKAPVSNSAYPPMSKLNNNIPMLPQNLPMESAAVEKMYLPSGQRVAFAGTRVFTYNESGTPIPMPDGQYTLDGRKLVIKDGNRVLY